MRHLAVLVLCVAPCLFVHPATADLGKIDFPTSARSSDAKAHFIRGVLLLHSFTYESAAAAFQEASRIEPDFAMAYWGEALSYNHPLLSLRDIELPRAALARLAPTPTERLAKAETAREKGLLSTVEVLFGEGTEAARARAYADAVRDLAEKYPDDHEIQALYAVALLSLSRHTGDRDFRIRIRAGAIAGNIFRQNPVHPGAAHYIIHAFDDPVHAPLALTAAYRYAEIAPDSAHALHMPSHIFIQHGMWERVVSSNDASYESAIQMWRQRSALDETAKHYNDVYVWHALDWGQYGSLQLGDFAAAKRAIALLSPVAEKSEAPWIVNGPATMYARFVVESEAWEILPIEGAPAEQVFASGLSAVHLGELDMAKAAEQRLAAMFSEAERTPNVKRAKQAGIRYTSLSAMIALAEGRADQAIALADEAIAIVEEMDAPRGAAVPIKPAYELRGEIFLALGRPSEALESFETALLRMPNRRLSLRGLAAATSYLGGAENSPTSPVSQTP